MVADNPELCENYDEKNKANDVRSPAVPELPVNVRCFNEGHRGSTRDVCDEDEEIRTHEKQLGEYDRREGSDDDGNLHDEGNIRDEIGSEEYSSDEEY